MRSCGTLDDPAITEARAVLLRSHPYLSRLYTHWYKMILAEIPKGIEPVLELGSGGGFFKDLLPQAITSDVMPVREVDHKIDARRLPFGDVSLRAVTGTNVLHHIPEIESFFDEAQRVLVDGGRLVFIEPWPTALSLPVYRYLHHEPFDRSSGWDIPAGGPLTAANGALPWILFHRDFERFHRAFPKLKLVSAKPFMPFSYLACGGIGKAWRLPGEMFDCLRFLEKPFDGLGLFANVVLEKYS